VHARESRNGMLIFLLMAGSAAVGWVFGAIWMFYFIANRRYHW
jgi:hypothetical protein